MPEWLLPLGKGGRGKKIREKEFISSWSISDRSLKLTLELGEAQMMQKGIFTLEGKKIH